MQGKWHLGYWRWEHTPAFRGFDSYLGYLVGGEDYYSHTEWGGYDMREQRSPMCGENCSRVRWDLRGTYSTHIFAAAAVDIIQSHDHAVPLFLYLAFQAVHAPAEVPASYAAPYLSNPRFRNESGNARATFAGMLACLDQGLGNITAALKSRSMWGAGDATSTIFILSTDNGAPTPECGGAQGGQNWPYRGGECDQQCSLRHLRHCSLAQSG